MKNKFCDLKFWYQFTNARIIDIFENKCFKQKLVETITENSSGGSTTITTTSPDGSVWTMGVSDAGTTTWTKP